MATAEPSTQRNTLIPSLVIGAVNGVILIVLVFSFAALIFKDRLTPYYEAGVGYFLIGTAIITLTLALFSAFKSSVGLPQDNPTAIVAVAAVLLSGELTEASVETLFYTVMMVIILSSLVTGVLFFLIGRYNWGSVIKYIPYPIVGGVIAATGWVLVTGAIGIMSDIDVSLLQILDIFQPSILIF